MDTQRPEVKKIEFFEIFNPKYMRENISVGVSEQVIVSLQCAEFTFIDRDVFQAIWSYGDKTKVSGTVVSTINAGVLFSHVPEVPDALEDVLRRLSSVSIEVTYSQNRDRYQCRYNIFDLAITNDAVGNLIAVTMGAKSLEVLDWLFCHDLIELLMGNALEA